MLRKAGRGEQVPRDFGDASLDEPRVRQQLEVSANGQVDAIADHVGKVVGGLKAQDDARIIGKESRQNPAERELRDADRTGQGDRALQLVLAPAHRRFGHLTMQSSAIFA